MQRITIVLCTVVCADGLGQAPPSPPTTQAVMPQPISEPSGDLITMPRNLPASRRNGMRLTVDTRWVNSYGYRPVEVSILSPVATTSRYAVTVQLHTGGENDLSVERSFELPVGATKASTVVLVPSYEQSVFGFWWDVWVDGVKDVDLSIKQEDAWRRGGTSNVSASTAKILVPGTQSTQKSLVSTTVSDFEVFSLTLGEFPRRWIEYTCFDVVSLSTAELDQLVATNPTALEAITLWVRTGGQLWVCDAGDKLEKLPAISKQLQVPNDRAQPLVELAAKDPNAKSNEKEVASGGEQLGDRTVEVGWRPGRMRGFGPPGQSQGYSDARSGRTRWANDPAVIRQLDQDPNFARTFDQTPGDDPNFERRSSPDSGSWYLEQRLGLGTLRAFRGPNEAAVFAHSAPAANVNAAANGNADPGQIPRPLAASLRSTRKWDARHGMVPDASNAEFAKLLVPGVGRAPVAVFQVLITLFVLLIGPLNYWILKRYKRLQLLVLTVPLAAGIASAALFAYAIVADGFATKVRVRSYATIDQQSGDAACWGWMSYYAGLAPGKGLLMPADIAVYPILPNWGGDNGGTNRAMLWDGNSEQLSQGWMTSRTPTQYLSVRSRKTPHRLDVTAGKGKMQVVNRLGTQIETLLALDESGKFFAGDGLVNEARVALTPITRDDAVRRIVALVRDNEPQYPDELTGGDRDFIGRQSRASRRQSGRYRSQGGEGLLTESLAGRAISDLAGMNGRPALELPARTYVAITTSGPEIETGISYAVEEDSFHVVVGHW